MADVVELSRRLRRHAAIRQRLEESDLGSQMLAVGADESVLVPLHLDPTYSERKLIDDADAHVRAVCAIIAGTVTSE